MMNLILAQLPSTLTGPDGDGYNGKVPARALYAHPEAFFSLIRLERAGGLVYTDIFRGAQGQLAAKRRNPATTKAVSLSPHGYGLAVDLDVDATLKRRGWLYQRLLDEMGKEGWYCHRRDQARGSEDWHFNFLSVQASVLLPKASIARRGTWDDPVEGRIQQLYGAQLAPGDDEIPTLLTAAHVNGGDAAAVKAFQTMWDLDADGIVGPNTRRVLAYTTAQLDVRGMFA